MKHKILNFLFGIIIGAMAILNIWYTQNGQTSVFKEFRTLCSIFSMIIASILIFKLINRQTD